MRSTAGRYEANSTPARLWTIARQAAEAGWAVDISRQRVYWRLRAFLNNPGGRTKTVIIRWAGYRGGWRLSDTQLNDGRRPVRAVKLGELPALLTQLAERTAVIDVPLPEVIDG